jgi:hypothetical protein
MIDVSSPLFSSTPSFSEKVFSHSSFGCFKSLGPYLELKLGPV